MSNSKELIIEATKALVKEKGVYEINIREICRKAGLSTGTFYHFFHSKEELFLTACATDPKAYNLCECIEEKAEEPSKHIEAFLLSLADNFVADGWKYTEFVLRSHRKEMAENGKDDRKEIYFSRQNQLATFIGTAQEVGTIKKEFSADELAAFILRTARGIVYEWVDCQGGFDLIKKSKETIYLILHGIL